MLGPIAVALAVCLSGTPNAAPKKTQLRIEVQPETAVLYVDGKRKGTGGKLHVLTVKPGSHRIKVQNKGDEHQELVTVKKGEVKTYTWAFEDDRRDRHAVSRNAAKAEAPAAEEKAEEAVTSDPDLDEERLSDAFDPPTKR